MPLQTHIPPAKTFELHLLQSEEPATHDETGDTQLTGPERRATPRISLEVPIEVREGTHKTFRVTSDLSTFGFATRQGRALPRGTRLLLALYLPDHAAMPVLIEGEVIGAFEEARGMRLAFRHPSAEAARRIHRFLYAGVGAS